MKKLLKIAKKLGYPVLVRPSFVLGGRAMDIVYDEVGAEGLCRRKPSKFPASIRF